MRQVFKDQEHEAALKDKGFVVLDLLDANTIIKCRSLFDSIDPKLDKGFYTSLESANQEYRNLTNYTLKEIIGGTILEPFVDYTMIGFTFNVKLPREDSETPFHLDDCHVDEEKYVSVNVWIPLVDTSIENGTLHVVPKSHKIPHPIRAMGIGFPYNEFIPLLEKHSLAVPLKKGQVLFFDSRIIHWAPPNLSGQIRPAIVSGLIPKEADSIVFMHHDSLQMSQLEKFYAPFDFFSSVVINKRPHGYPSLGIYEYVKHSFSEEELLSYIA